MCFGGGNDAAQQAQIADDQRRQQIAYTSGNINAAFDDPAREAQLQDYLSATRQYYGQQLQKQATVADQGNRFALARSGLAGGSVDADSNTRLTNDYNDASLLAEQKAQAAYNGLKASDDTARQNLLQLAQSGAQVTNAQTQAADSFASSLAANRAQVTNQGLGDLFGDVTTANQASNDAAARRLAVRQTTNPYAPNTGFGPGFS